MLDIQFIVIIRTNMSYFFCKIQDCSFEYTVQRNNHEKGRFAKIHLRWHSNNPIKKDNGKLIFQAKNLDYTAEISYTNVTRPRRPSTIQLQLKMFRKFTRCLVENILPTGLLVLVCSVSIWQHIML